eukprot:323641_1
MLICVGVRFVLLPPQSHALGLYYSSSYYCDSDSPDGFVCVACDTSPPNCCLFSQSTIHNSLYLASLDPRVSHHKTHRFGAKWTRQEKRIWIHFSLLFSIDSDRHMSAVSLLLPITAFMFQSLLQWLVFIALNRTFSD